MKIFIPKFAFPASWLTFNSFKTSIGSSPAFSAKVIGINSSAFANSITANLSLPESVFENFINLLESSISIAPAPATIFLSLITVETSPNPSFNALSISSMT